MAREDPIYGYLIGWDILRKYDVIKSRLRRFLRRSLVLKIKPNTGQTPGTTDKRERRKNMAKSEGGALFTIETLKTSYCCIEIP